MKPKKEIDRDYYLRHKEEVSLRNAKYQKEHPESHRKASKEYERRNYKRKNKIKIKIKIIGIVVDDLKLGNKVIYFKDLNPDYCEMARKRILDECGGLF